MTAPFLYGKNLYHFSVSIYRIHADFSSAASPPPPSHAHERLESLLSLERAFQKADSGSLCRGVGGGPGSLHFCQAHKCGCCCLRRSNQAIEPASAISFCQELDGLHLSLCHNSLTRPLSPTRLPQSSNTVPLAGLVFQPNFVYRKRPSWAHKQSWPAPCSVTPRSPSDSGFASFGG